MNNSIKDINHSPSIQAETLGEPAKTEASWYAMRVYMNKVALCRDQPNLLNNEHNDPDQTTEAIREVYCLNLLAACDDSKRHKGEEKMCLYKNT